MTAENVLSPEILNALDVLLSASDKFVFGGSFGLKAFGVLDREVKDLDVIIAKDRPLKDYGFGGRLPAIDSLKRPRLIRNARGDNDIMYTITLGAIPVDVFPVDELEYSVVSFAGRNLKIQSLEAILSAKQDWMRYYEARANKHRKDFQEIERNSAGKMHKASQSS